MASAAAKKRRRAYRKRPKEERDADEAVARLYALDRAERGVDDRRAAKIARFAAVYGVTAKTLDELAPAVAPALRPVPESTPGARADLVVIDDLATPSEETLASFRRWLGKDPEK